MKRQWASTLDGLRAKGDFYEFVCQAGQRDNAALGLSGLSTAMIGLSVMLAGSVQAQDLEHFGDNGIHPILRIGAHAPGFDLPGVDGKMHNIKEYAASKVLVVIFS